MAEDIPIDGGDGSVRLQNDKLFAILNDADETKEVPKSMQQQLASKDGVATQSSPNVIAPVIERPDPLTLHPERRRLSLIKSPAAQKWGHSIEHVKAARMIQAHYVSDVPSAPRKERSDSDDEDDIVVPVTSVNDNMLRPDDLPSTGAGNSYRIQSGGAEDYIAAAGNPTGFPRFQLQARYVWFRLSRMCKKLIRKEWFKSFVMGVIGIAAVTVGIQTYDVPDSTKDFLSNYVEPFVQWVFVVEAVATILSYDLKPWNYFRSSWNIFDFCVVVASFLPIGSSQVTTLRLLRLMRVLKLVKALPKLRVLVVGLINSLSSLGYIAILMGLQFYLWAVLGVILLGDNDPVYYGALHRALVSLWQGATGDSWTDHMYTAIYGCDAPQITDNAYSDHPERCVNPQALGFFIPALFFISFTVIASLMLLNLFVGAILMAVNDARAEDEKGDVLTVTLVRAERLVAADLVALGGASDPYVTLQIGSMKFKSRVLKVTLNPVWNQSWDFFPLAKLDSDVLSIYVKDWDRFGNDDPLGDFHIKLAELKFNQEYTFRCELNNVPHGTVVVKVFKHCVNPKAADPKRAKDRLELLMELAQAAKRESENLAVLVRTLVLKDKKAQSSKLRTLARKFSQAISTAAVQVANNSTRRLRFVRDGPPSSRAIAPAPVPAMPSGIDN